jgi:hypothetical protein
MYMQNNLQAFPGDVLPLVTSLFNPASGGAAPAGGVATPLTPGGNINVSPTVQAQVSPQISPVFQQQFQPKGSPATAGTQRMTAPIPRPAHRLAVHCRSAQAIRRFPCSPRRLTGLAVTCPILFLAA